MAYCWVGTRPLSEPMMEYYWFDPWDHTSMKCYQNSHIFIHENLFEILSWPQCVKESIRYNTEYSWVIFLQKSTELNAPMVISEGDLWSVL